MSTAVPTPPLSLHVCTGFGRTTQDTKSRQSREAMAKIRQGYKHSSPQPLSYFAISNVIVLCIGFNSHGGFDAKKSLRCIVDPDKLGQDEEWVKAFQEDPLAANKKFSDKKTLHALALELGVIIIDGAHR